MNRTAPPSECSVLDVARALELATRRHPGFDWATSTVPLGSPYRVSLEPPRLLITPELNGTQTFEALMAGLRELDEQAEVSNVVPLRIAWDPGEGRAPHAGTGR